MAVPDLDILRTSWVSKASVKRLNLVKDEDNTVTPNGDTFCTSKTQKCLLTQILEELLGQNTGEERVGR